jgi:hypothetical protein
VPLVTAVSSAPRAPQTPKPNFAYEKSSMDWRSLTALSFLLLSLAVAGEVSAASPDENRVCPVAEWRVRTLPYRLTVSL